MCVTFDRQKHAVAGFRTRSRVAAVQSAPSASIFTRQSHSSGKSHARSTAFPDLGTLEVYERAEQDERGGEFRGGVPTFETRSPACITRRSSTRTGREARKAWSRRTRRLSARPRGEIRRQDAHNRSLRLQREPLRPRRRRPQDSPRQSRTVPNQRTSRPKAAAAGRRRAGSTDSQGCRSEGRTSRLRNGTRARGKQARRTTAWTEMQRMKEPLIQRPHGGRTMGRAAIPPAKPTTEERSPSRTNRRIPTRTTTTATLISSSSSSRRRKSVRTAP